MQGDGRLAGVFGALLLCLAAALGANFLRNGAAPDCPDADALLCGKVLVRIADSRGHSGVYAEKDAAPLEHFLSLSGHQGATTALSAALLARRLHGGESVFLDYKGGKFIRTAQIWQMAAAERFSLGLCLNMNRASEDDWALLPYVGVKTASAIVAQRQAQGGFRNADDLLAVRGIGEKKLARLRPYLCGEKQPGITDETL